MTPEYRRRGLRDRAVYSSWDPVWDDLSTEFRGLLITCTEILRGICEGDIAEADWNTSMAYVQASLRTAASSLDLLPASSHVLTGSIGVNAGPSAGMWPPGINSAQIFSLREVQAIQAIMGKHAQNIPDPVTGHSPAVASSFHLLLNAVIGILEHTLSGNSRELGVASPFLDERGPVLDALAELHRSVATALIEHPRATTLSISRDDTMVLLILGCYIENIDSEEKELAIIETDCAGYENRIGSWWCLLRK